MKKSLLMVFALFVALLQQAQAQDRTISGKVTDRSTSQGLPGVTVLAKGTTVGTSTNADGGFSLSVPASATTLVFSFVGYATQEQAIGSASTIDVTLATDAKQLSEVVVTALGLTANRDELGTAQATVQGVALVRSGETNVITALSGKTPGVLITRTSGDPGASANIQIRGASTITGNLQPLIVVDGIPVFNSSVGDEGILVSNGGAGSNQVNGVVQQSRLGDINPDDIASMEVLKGAAASAVWGTRAANGVIVITTKKGRGNANGKLNLSYRTSYGIDQINRVPGLQRTFGQGTNGIYNGTTGNSWGDKIADRTGGPDNEITNPSAPGYNGFITFPDGTRRYAVANGTASNPHGGKNSRETYDQARAPFTTGSTWDNIATLSGGDNGGNFYVSLGNTYQKGIARFNSDYDRTTARVNVDRQLSDKLRASVNTSYIRTRSKRAQQGSNVSGIYLGGLRTSPDFDNSRFVGDYTDRNGNVFLDRQVGYRNKIGTVSGDGITRTVYDNPLWTQDRVQNTSRVNRFLGALELTYDITPWLNILNRTGVDTYADNRRAYFPVGAAAAVQGSLTEEVIQETQVNNDLILRANRSLTENITITGLIGYNLNGRRSSQVGATATQFINPFSPPQLSNTPASSRTPFNLVVEQRTAALYGQLDLGLFNQLFLSGTVRGEQASTFGPEANSTFIYPAASAAWQFTKLGALAENRILSFGKARASFGTVGVQPTPYLTRTYYTGASSAIIGDGWGTAIDAANYGGGFVRSTTQGNATLKPERKTEFEGGLDLRFFSDRVGLNVTGYANKTVDAILSVPVAASTGFQSTNGNVASIQNRGFELSLDGDVIRTGGFTWNIAPNFSLNRNKVLELAGAESIFLTGFTGTSSRAVQGHQLGALWGTEFGRNESGGYILDANGFPTLADGGTERVIGDPNPKWRGGLNNTFSFKGLSLNVLVDHVNSFDVWNGTKGALYFFGTSDELEQETTVSASEAANLRRYNGTTVASSYPLVNGNYTFRGTVGNFGGNNVALDEQWYRAGLGNGFSGGPAKPFIENVSYTRLREVSLIYTLNQDWLRNATKLAGIDLSVTGRNLYLWTNYTGVDPETNLTGVSNGRGLDYFNNPSTRSVIFSIKFTY
ncbi:SusC/RagA family TonB-linked outer membrane protein [Hymenobacter sp. B1770]|uniref:SusC/RagA family TonB-linked outer membrane protein n=1 Tax=Hymenobacter sp. B1770 TaxID=1718788 RepID=UPI003CE82F3D